MGLIHCAALLLRAARFHSAQVLLTKSRGVSHLYRHCREEFFTAAQKLDIQTPSNFGGFSALIWGGPIFLHH
jgi:hypothetical protein